LDEERKIQTSQAKFWAFKKGMKYFEVSAKNNIGVN